MSKVSTTAPFPHNYPALFKIVFFGKFTNVYVVWHSAGLQAWCLGIRMRAFYVMFNATVFQISNCLNS